MEYTPHKAEAARMRGALIVDTRTETQRAEAGELPGAVLIDRIVFDPARTRIAEATTYDIEVVVMCRQGYSSRLAAESPRRVGLYQATDVDEWQPAGVLHGCRLLYAPR